MSNKKQGAEELMEDYIKIPVKKAIAEKSTIYVETAIKFAKSYANLHHIQKRAEELEGITENDKQTAFNNYFNPVARNDVQKRLAFGHGWNAAINHLKNKKP